MADDENKVEIEDWASAFAALDQDIEKDDKADSNTGNGIADDSKTADTGEIADNVETGDIGRDESGIGGLDSDAGIVSQENGESIGSDTQASHLIDDFDSFHKSIEDNIRQRAVMEVGNEFIKRGIRQQHNGKLGASINDPDICKRDEDGVAHYYNPDTGEEFTGANPRREAKEWVDDYNDDLNEMFEEACNQYQRVLYESIAPQIAVQKFAPVYNSMNPVTKMMFDNVLEGHEAYDGNGNVIGHDLSAFGGSYENVLNLVNKQIKSIQSYANENRQQATGPALDMKTSSGAIPSGDRPAPTSLAEAMERLQDMELEKNKR